MPAKKARFFKVTARDGHGVYEKFIPASSKADLTNNLTLPGNEKLIGIQHLGFKPVEAAPNDDRGTVEFIAEVESTSVTIGAEHQGHDYLKQQFPNKVKEVEEYYQEKYQDYES